MRDQDDVAEGPFQVPTFRQAADLLAGHARHSNAFHVSCPSECPIPSMRCGEGSDSGEFGCGNAFCPAEGQVLDAEDHGC